MQLDYKKGAMPLYLQIKEVLKQQIEQKVFSYGDLLPTELELEKRFSVSRITVRQAVLDLEKEGYVKRARGIGTTVTYSDKIDETLSSIRSFHVEMQERGKQHAISYKHLEVIEASEHVADCLSLQEDKKIIYLERIRQVDGEPIVYSQTYIPAYLNIPTDVEAYSKSMYEVYIAYGIDKPVLVNEKLEALLADSQLAAALEIAEGSAIFKRTRLGFDRNNQAIEYTYSYYRGDRYAYSIQLKE